MAYQPNIPLATDLISNSQGDIQGNFQAIDSGTTGLGVGFSRNHITMTDAAIGGKHYRVDFPDASVVPVPAGTESSIYPALIAAKQEMKFKNATNDIQITNSLLAAASGQGMLPGGLQLRIGSGLLPLDGANHTFNLSLPFPTATLIALPIVDSTNMTHNIQYSAASSDNTKVAFGTFNVGGNAAIIFLAIGY